MSTTSTTTTTTTTATTTTAKELARVYGECPATSNGRHHVAKGGACCIKCGAR